MRTKFFYKTILLSIMICIAHVTEAQVANNNNPMRNTNVDWYAMMQDPDANFFETQAAFYDYWSKNTYTKGSMYKVFKRWEYITQGQAGRNGKLRKPEYVVSEYYKFKETFPESTTAGWTQIGPINMPSNGTSQPNGLGRVNGVAFHPTDPNIIYVAAPSGGLWKTFDNGANWYGLTDDLPTLGTSAVVLDYTNPDIVYIGTGDRDAHNAPGLGVYKSYNSGGSFSASNTGMGNVTVNMLVINPLNNLVLVAATSGGIFKTFNGGANWQRCENYYYNDFKDIKYKPGDTTVMYAIQGGSFFKSVNGGQSWGITSTGIGYATRLVIGVSPAQPGWVYLCKANPTFGGLLKSENSGDSFTTLATTPNILGYECNGSDTKNQSGYDLAIAVGRTNANVIHIGGINIWRSTDGGAHFAINTHWLGCSGVPALHADIHSLDYNPLNNRLYCGNDGGLQYSANGTSWTEISSGLAIAQVYKIGQSNYSQNVTMNGYQDNGTSLASGTSFNTVIGGDGMECAIDWGTDNYKYGEAYYGEILRSVNGGTFTHIAYNPDPNFSSHGITETGAWVTPFIIDRSNANIMFAGYKNVWRTTNVKASASSVAWSRISSGETNDCSVVAQPQLDNNILYVARYNSGSSGASLKRSDNAQTGSPAWTTCTLPEGHPISDIETHPYDLNIIYATADSGVYISTDKGINWTNISDNLPDVPINCIVLDIAGWGTERLYVGTSIGVYYKNENMVHWASYNQGLPVMDVRELEIFYSSEPGESRIKAATYGRGLWQSPLFSFPDYPTFVDASDGTFPDKVHITWSPAAGEGYYRVFRSSFNNSGMAAPISDWITDWEFDDYTPIPGIPQYYWVVSSPDPSGADPSPFNSSDAGNIASPIMLADDASVPTSSAAHYYTFSNQTNNWCIAGVRGNNPAEFWDIQLYNDNAFQTVLATSNALTPTNYILVNNNYVTPSVKGIKVSLPAGSSDAHVEYEDGTEIMTPNTIQTFDWPAGDVADVYEVHLTPGTYQFSCNITNGSGNLDIALYGSDIGNFNYQSRSDALAYSTAAGGGGNESFSFTVTLEDDYAFVLFSNDNLSAGGYLRIETAGMWLGTYDNNWHNAGNWSMGVVPDATTDVTIPPVTNRPWIYAGTANCHNLILQPGTNYLRIYNQFLVVHGDMTIHRQLMMDNPTPDAHLTVYGNINWEPGSTAWVENNTYITVHGNWNFKPGSNVQINGGIVIFSGSGASEIISGDDDCHFYDITLAKTDANVTISSASTDTLNIYGNLVVNAGSGLFGYSNHYIAIKGNISSSGYFYLNTGTCMLNGSLQSVQTTAGNFFRHLYINAETGVNMLSDLTVQGSLTIHHGYLDCNASDIYITENWLNQVGADGFIEHDQTVVFNGGNWAQYCSSESFYNLEISKIYGNALRIWAAVVQCQHYNWTAGAIDVNLGVFQADDLTDSGIYGDWYVNPTSYVNLTNTDGYVDLNGNIIMLGGEFNVYGGADASYWGYDGNAGLMMTDGILDFHDVGINLVPSSNTLTTYITGGTIKTSSYFNLSREGFAPTGGTVELYGTLPAFVSQSSGVNFYNLTVNKSDPAAGVTANSDLAISHDLLVQQGTFEVNTSTIYIANDLNVSSNIRMNNDAGVIRVARHTNWLENSTVEMNADATFRAFGSWTFHPNSNVQMNNGKVIFFGATDSFIISNEANSHFYNLLISKTGDSEVNVFSLSSDTCKINGDLLIFPGARFVSYSPWLISIEGMFSNSGNYRFNSGEVALHQPLAAIEPGPGDYFSTLRLEGSSGAMYTFNSSRSDTLRVNNDLHIGGAGLIMTNKILTLGRDWYNPGGDAAFIEGTSKVIANGFSGSLQHINCNETFYDFEIAPVNPSDYPSVITLGEGSNLTILNDLSLTRGRLMLSNNAILNTGRHINIASGASLYAFNANTMLNIGGNWYDYNMDISATSGFEYGNTTVNFNGSSDQYIYQYGSGTAIFGNVQVNKTGTTLWPGNDIEVRGNFDLMNGNYENFNDSRQLGIFGNLTTMTGTGFYPRGILNFKGNNNSDFTINGSGWIKHLDVFKETPMLQVNLRSNIVSMTAGNLVVDQGVLNLLGYYYRCTGSVSISLNAKMTINSDAWLEVGNSGNVSVMGVLEALGSEGHPAKVTHNSGYYDFSIKNGGTISASHALFEYMGSNGLYLEPGSTVDATNSFNNCIFQNGSPFGTLIRADNSQEITANNVYFPANSNGCTSNVAKTMNEGSITFMSASGSFAGEAFENDTYGRLHWGAPTKTLSLNLFVEGLFNAATGQMNKAYDAEGEHFAGLQADEVAIDLHEATSPYGIVHSITNLPINMDGSVTTTVPGIFGSSYYLAIRHRNSIETWSATPISFSGIGISYNFTDAANKAFGNNLKEISGAYVIQGGDVNQDDVIDELDMIPVVNQAATFGTGYIPEDINGDGIIDAIDMIVIDNNAAAFVGAVLP